MELSEDVPLEKCLAIDKLTSSHGSSKYQKSIIEDGLIPQKWNVVILDFPNVEKNVECIGGIYANMNILKQMLPTEHSAIPSIYDGKDRNIYILYSGYIEEIKIVLPVACSIEDASFEGKITPKLNTFLHYVNAKKEILDVFQKEIFRAVIEEKIGFFSKLSQLDQDILKKNMTEENYEKVLRLFWSYFFDGKLSEYCYALEKGINLTHELFSYVHARIKEKEKTYRYRNYMEYIHVINSIELILKEHKRKEDILNALLKGDNNNDSSVLSEIGKYKYLSVVNFHYAFCLAIRNGHKSFLENIFK
jgi:hypothetical protein